MSLQTKKILLVIIILFLSFIQLGCQSKEVASGVSNTMEISNDIEKVREYINLPNQPTRILWKVEDITMPSTLPGPTDWALIAILTFDHQTVDNIIESSTISQQNRRPEIPEKYVELFPEELKNKLKPSENTGFFVTNQPGYAPDIFAKSPLRHGYFVRLGKTSSLFLYLFTV